MQVTDTFLVPDYYPDFHCKIGSCRHTCCEDWPICVSMTDYFHLLSIPVSVELRSRIDTHLRVCDHPTPERYAQLCPQYDGNCAMRMSDGRCGLQVEVGEGVLAVVCRMYPRGVRTGESYECSCANSCEAVLELFFHRESPIGFIRQTITYEQIPSQRRTVYFETCGRSWEIRQHLLRIIQDRRQSLPLRILSLGEELIQLNELVKQSSAKTLDEFLSVPPQRFDDSGLPVTEEHLLRGLEMAEAMMARVNEHNHRVGEFGEVALQWFNCGGSPLSQYHMAREHFATAYPRWEIIFEHMLVNHMFFEQFPFQDRPLDLFDECIALCGVYTLMRFLGLGCLSERTSEMAFIDLYAATYRLVSHTSFDHYAAGLLKRLGYADQRSDMYSLLRL